MNKIASTSAATPAYPFCAAFFTSPNEYAFLQRMFARFPEIGEKFERYLEMPVDARIHQAILDVDETPRAGLVERGVPNPETVGDHTRRLIVAIHNFTEKLIIAPPINRSRMLKMAMVHDLPEAITGDFTPQSDISSVEKHKLENLAARVIFEHRLDLLSIHTKYEKKKLFDAKLVNDLDKIDACRQALVDEGKNPHLSGKIFPEHYEYAKERMLTPIGRSMLEELATTQTRIRTAARDAFRDKQKGLAVA